MKISRYLKASPELAAVTQQAERLLALQQIFEATAPPGLARHCRVANFKQGVLIILAANALLAAKLRQLIPSLTNDFCNRGWQVTAIQVSVQDQPASAENGPSALPELPAAARAELEAFARTAPDPRIRTAVLHLLDAAASGPDKLEHGDGEPQSPEKT
jgi:hypothetical protein